MYSKKPNTHFINPLVIKLENSHFKKPTKLL